ncbi:MAG: flagellin [Gammaproteobacteria bacterium]|nr:flagellin [Gammaproteobacteria bacterium]
MANVVNTNMMSINAQRSLYKTDILQKTAMERLASGLRVNSAKDDAAGMSIAERMTSQIRGMTVAVRNANDGLSMAQTAEGAITELQGMLQRMRDLTIQSMNATNAVSDRKDLNTEFQQLKQEIGRIIGNTEFNGKKILNTSGTSYQFQVGANTASNNRIKVSLANLSNASVGIGSAMTAGMHISTQTGASAVAKGNSVITVLDGAINKLNNLRGRLGAAQNRFNATISNLQSSIENQSAARSRIMDADFAAETANLSRAQILQQAGIAMLAQANQAPQAVLGLLR